MLFFSEERTRETFSFASIEGLRRGRRGGCVGGARRGEGRGVCHRAGWNGGAVGKDQGAGRRRALSRRSARRPPFVRALTHGGGLVIARVPGCWPAAVGSCACWLGGSDGTVGSVWVCPGPPPLKDRLHARARDSVNQSDSAGMHVLR